MSENAAIHRDAFRLITEDLLGSGIARNTYSSKAFPNCVVKVEEGVGSFQNVIEWETWGRVKHTQHAKWFAPCEWISPNGSVLIMRRTEPAQKRQYPERMPSFLSDFKRANYGMLDGRLVCHDYGTNLLMEYGMTKRMIKANWWDL